MAVCSAGQMQTSLISRHCFLLTHCETVVHLYYRCILRNYFYRNNVLYVDTYCFVYSSLFVIVVVVDDVVPWMFTIHELSKKEKSFVFWHFLMFNQLGGGDPILYKCHPKQCKYCRTVTQEPIYVCTVCALYVQIKFTEVEADPVLSCGAGGTQKEAEECSTKLTWGVVTNIRMKNQHLEWGGEGFILPCSEGKKWHPSRETPWYVSSSAPGISVCFLCIISIPSTPEELWGIFA